MRHRLGRWRRSRCIGASCDAFLKRDSGSTHAAAADPTRFGDCGEIDYCVASLLRFAPWLRTIHIVTDAQTPSLMERLKGTPFEDRVRVVDHKVIFSGYEQFLPTFSSLSIEAMLWRIPGLAERFIYLNDDFQIIRPVALEDFFRDDGVVLRGKWRGHAACAAWGSGSRRRCLVGCASGERPIRPAIIRRSN